MVHDSLCSEISNTQGTMLDDLKCSFFYNRKVTNLQEGSHGKNNFVYYCYYKAK